MQVRDDRINEQKSKEAIEEAKRNFSNIIVQNLEYLNIIKLLSLLSLIFKEKFQNDELVQNLEVCFLRRNSYKITTFSSIVEILENQSSEQKSQKEEITNLTVNDIFKKIFFKINNDILSVDKISIDANKLLEIISCAVDENGKLITKYILDKKNTNSQIKIPIENNKKYKYTLSPTSGIAMLNRNPYEFFVSKVLNLKPIDDWDNNLSARLYGEIVHQIMQNFSNKIHSLPQRDFNNLKKNINNENLKNLFNDSVNDVLCARKINNSIFLQKKITRIANVAVNLELEALKKNYRVLSEKEYSTIIDCVRIYAKADRIEIDDKNRYIYIYDFKTGEIPNNNDEKNGIKTQLLIIAMLILKLQQYKDYSIKRMQYIDLSGKENVTNNDIDVNEIDNTEDNIRQQISVYFSNGKPNVKNMIYIEPSGFLYQKDYYLMKFYRKKFINN